MMTKLWNNICDENGTDFLKVKEIEMPEVKLPQLKVVGSDYTPEMLNISISELQDKYYNPEPEDEGVDHFEETIKEIEYANSDLTN